MFNMITAIYLHLFELLRHSYFLLMRLIYYFIVFYLSSQIDDENENYEIIHKNRK